MIPNFSGDRISVEPLSYSKEKVWIVGETCAQRSIAVNSDLRTSLSDAIFLGIVRNITTSDFSQIYVLGKGTSCFKLFF